jgi:hypothetical protein
MTTTHPLTALMDEVAAGRFPPADGTVVVAGPPPGKCQAVAAFTAFHVIAVAVPESEIRARLDPDDLGAPMDAGFLSWLGERIGRHASSFDQVMVATGLGEAAGLEQIDAATHPRAERARRYRVDVAVYRHGPGIVITGLGLAHRREVSVDLPREHRGRGMGAELARLSRGLVPKGEPVFAQVAPGNAVSVRAFLAAGFRPIGAEILFPPS